MQVRHRPKPRLQLTKKRLAKDQLPVPRQLLLHLLVHLLIRDAGPPHLVLVIDQDLPDFLVEPVLDGELFQHAHTNPVGHRSGGLGFDLPAFDQAFHKLVRHVRYKVPYEKHFSEFPLHKRKRVSLLAAPIKCKETHGFAQKSPTVGRTMPCLTSATNADIRHGSANTRGAFAPALTALVASCTMNWVRALSSAVRAFGLHPKGRPFKSDSAHHCDATPFSGDVVQLVRTLPC